MMERNNPFDLVAEVEAGVSENMEQTRRLAEDDARKQWLIEGDVEQDTAPIEQSVSMGDIDQDLDFVRMANDDRAAGIDRQPRSYSPRYLHPKRRTVRGIDLSTGLRELDRGSVDNPLIEEDVKAGVELLRQSTVSSEGVDDKGIQGMARVARSIIRDGGDYQEYSRAIEQYGAPPKVGQMAFVVAQEAMAEEDLEVGYSAPITEQELMEVAASTDQYDEPDLLLEDTWTDSAQVIWEAEHNRKWDGTRQELWQYGLELMSGFNNRVAGVPGVAPGSMAYFTTQAVSRSSFDDNQYAKALYSLTDMYERTNINLNTFGRGVGAAVTDPLSMFGFGIIGKQAYKVAANRVKRLLSAAGITGGVEGALFMTADEMSRQKIAVEAGVQEEIEYGAVAPMAIGGGILGIGLGKSFDFLLSPSMQKKYAQWGEKLADKMRNNPKTATVTAAGAMSATAKAASEVNNESE